MNVGSLIAYLDLDDTNFDRKTKSANKQIDGLALNMEALGKLNPELKLKTDAAAAKAQALKAELDRLKIAMASAEDPAEIRVDVAATMMKLAAVKAEMRALHAEAAKPIKVQVDQSALSKLSSDLDGISKKMKGVGSGGLFGSALAFGPALAPFGGAAVGMLGGITSAATEAVGAVGVLALALKGVSGASAAYQSYQTALGSANNTYAQALAAAGNKTGKARTSAIAAANQSHTKALGTAQFNLNQSAYGKSSAATQQFVKFDQTQLHPFGAGLMSSAQAGVLPGLTAGLQSLVKDAPQLNGALKTIGLSVGNLMAEAGHALDSPFWKQWIVWFGKDSAKNVGTMGHSVGQLVEALARMDQRSGGAGKIVADLDRLSTRLNNWSASPAFLTFLDHIRTDEAEASKFLKALWADLDPILKGLSATGGAEMQLLTGALSTISKLPTRWLDEAGRMLPLIFLTLKANQYVLSPLIKGFSTLSMSVATDLEAGMTKGQIALKGLGTAAKAAAGAAGVGLLLDGVTRSSGALSDLEVAAGAAATGFSIAGPLGAAIGGVGGLLFDAAKSAGLFSTQLSDTQVIDNATKHYADLAATLDSVTGAMTDLTRQQAVKTITDNGALQAALNAGFNQTQARDINLGTASASTMARYQKMLRSAQLDVNSATTKANAGARAAGYQTGPGINDGSISSWYNKSDKAAVDQASKELDLLKALAGGGDAAMNKFTADALSGLSAVNTKILTQAKLGPAAFHAFASGAATDLHSIEAMVKKFGITPHQVPIVMKALGLDQAKSEVNAVVQYAKSTQATIPINANTAAAFASIQALKASLGVSANFMGPVQSKPKVLPAHALGTNWASAGWAKVGEQGPELVKLNTGDQVIPHPRAMQMEGRQGVRSTGPVQITLVLDSGESFNGHIRGIANNEVLNELAYQGGN